MTTQEETSSGAPASLKDVQTETAIATLDLSMRYEDAVTVVRPKSGKRFDKHDISRITINGASIWLSEHAARDFLRIFFMKWASLGFMNASTDRDHENGKTLLATHTSRDGNESYIILDLFISEARTKLEQSKVARGILFLALSDLYPKAMKYLDDAHKQANKTGADEDGRDFLITQAIGKKHNGLLQEFYKLDENAHTLRRYANSILKLGPFPAEYAGDGHLKRPISEVDASTTPEQQHHDTTKSDSNLGEQMLGIEALLARMEKTLSSHAEMIQGLQDSMKTTKASTPSGAAGFETQADFIKFEAESDLEKRMDELQKCVDEFQKSLDGVQKSAINHETRLGVQEDLRLKTRVAAIQFQLTHKDGIVRKLMTAVGMKEEGNVPVIGNAGKHKS